MMQKFEWKTVASIELLPDGETFILSFFNSPTKFLSLKCTHFV